MDLMDRTWFQVALIVVGLVMVVIGLLMRHGVL